MANVLYADVVGILAKAQLAITALQAANVAIPGAISDLVTKANTILTNWPEVEAPGDQTEPGSLTAQLNDLASLAAYLAPEIGESSAIGGVIQSIQATAAGAANLTAGQLAVFATIPSSFDGTKDTVVIGAWRQSGTFGEMVNQGVTDANDVETPATNTKATKGSK